MKQPARREDYSEWETELAKRILCSTVSVQMGISYQHCWKTYVEPGLEEREVGVLYLECARFIRENVEKS